MKNTTTKVLVALALSSMLILPTYARGFGGGGFGGYRGGGFGGGGFDRGGFDRGADFDRGGFDRGFDRGAGGFDRGFDNANGVARAPVASDNWNGVKNYGYGGGFNKIAETRPMTQPATGYNQFTGHNPSQLAADGGLGAISQNRYNNFHPQNFNENDLSEQGTAVRNSFDHTTNVNNYGGYHSNYAGYPRAGYQNHPYGAYGYHPYGYHPYGNYGYHPYSFYGYPGGWYNSGFMEASMWTCMGLSSLTSFLGIAAMSSNRGGGGNTNVTYEGGNTYINAVPSQDYYQQAQQLAGTAGGDASSDTDATAMASPDATPGISSDVATPTAVPSSASDQWQPLGVYSLCEVGQKQSTTLFQLAINKDGIVRGNYMNQITNEKAQVHGALDKQSERISWTIGSNPSTVFSTTLKELMKQDSKVLVQFGPSSTQQMAFIRLPQPKQTDNEKSPQTS